MISDDITILISTSHVPEHPATDTIDATVASIRQSLPTSLLVIQCDGLASHHQDHKHRANYCGYKDRLKGRYDNAVLVEMPEDANVNQCGMLGRALEYVKTPFIFYLEHDWSISPNVQWDKLSSVLASGYYNLIRLYAYCRINPWHEGMMFEREWVEGVPFVRTIQYSQNPHLARTDFYRMMNSDFLQGRTIAIEEQMHGPCACGPWDRWKLAIYNPLDEGSMQMVRHLDGRKGER